MKDSHQSPISSPVESVEKNTSDSTDANILKNNPKIDHRLLAEYEHLIAASKGVIHVKQGADYNIAHPLASKDRPTDVHHIGKSLSKAKNT